MIAEQRVDIGAQAHIMQQLCRLGTAVDDVAEYIQLVVVRKAYLGEDFFIHLVLTVRVRHNVGHTVISLFQ